MSGGHAYEVSLSGEFFPYDLKAILNRITLHSESSTRINLREIVYEPLDANAQRERGIDPTLLRARRDLTQEDSSWEMYTYLKAESVRTYPDATVRPCATLEVIGDALSFAAALGYIKRSEVFKRGYAFRRGPLVILVFQEEIARANPEAPFSPTTLWEVEIKTASPIKDTPVKQAIEMLLEFQTLMKGLLDLRREDV